jgi:hypothetical protein
MTLVNDPDLRPKEACTASVPPAPEAIRAITPESETHRVPSEAEYPLRTDKELNANCKPIPNTVIDKLPLHDKLASLMADRTGALNALALTDDPCTLWTDNITFTEMALQYGAFDLMFESEVHFVNELMASLTEEAGE